MLPAVAAALVSLVTSPLAAACAPEEDPREVWCTVCSQTHCCTSYLWEGEDQGVLCTPVG